MGGANIKAALLHISRKSIAGCKIVSVYSPVWIKGKDSLGLTLTKLKDTFVKGHVRNLALTMTAELSDIYSRKSEGVAHVIETVEKLFDNSEIMVLDYKLDLLNSSRAIENYLTVGGANWAAGAWLAGQFTPDCIYLDIGSTTTDIIPIYGSKPAAKGKNDLERLTLGELVYTGATRTNIAAVTRKIPVNGISAKISSESFASSGDVHLILGNISQREYITETADGRGKSREEALTRLARVVCADPNQIGERELISMAQYVYKAQLKDIKESLIKVSPDIRRRGKTPIVCTGLGGRFLGARAAKEIGFKTILDLQRFFRIKISNEAAALAVALIASKKVGVDTVSWLHSSK